MKEAGVEGGGGGERAQPTGFQVPLDRGDIGEG